ncbi:hypothetical protein niasHT_034534 [Heterodera trifolii]|uniref:Uncharacterized protein n=1 Tax=Heterodera trifolii TaxID=157864 RepID=A0ABD2HVA9_9BILA
MAVKWIVIKMSKAFGHQLLLLRLRRPSFSPSSALFCPLFRATAAAFATVGAKKKNQPQPHNTKTNSNKQKRNTYNNNNR